MDLPDQSDRSININLIFKRNFYFYLFIYILHSQTIKIYFKQKQRQKMNHEYREKLSRNILGGMDQVKFALKISEPINFKNKKKSYISNHFAWLEGDIQLKEYLMKHIIKYPLDAKNTNEHYEIDCYIFNSGANTISAKEKLISFFAHKLIRNENDQDKMATETKTDNFMIGKINYKSFLITSQNHCCIMDLLDDLGIVLNCQINIDECPTIDKFKIFEEIKTFIQSNVY